VEIPCEGAGGAGGHGVPRLRMISRFAGNHASLGMTRLLKMARLKMTRLNQLAQRVVLLLLRGYKWAISPMFPPACRYVPTCSEYAMEAVERFGAARGGWMAVRRVLRCHPLAGGGHDPVVRSESGAGAVVEAPLRSRWLRQS
jgi:putative membrane protein insertion efficiency factor